MSLPLHHRLATPADAEALLGFIERLYVEDRIALQSALLQQGVSALLRDPAHGEALFWLDPAGDAVGYTIMTLCFSVERGGRYAMLDELYLVPQVRGRGHARHMLHTVAERARSRDVAWLGLEVSRHNIAAKGLYLANGYTDKQRDLLMLPLTDLAEDLPA